MKLLACALVLATATIHAQTVEVASIRPHKLTGDDSSNRQATGGHFIATATSVETLIRSAFAIDPKAIVNAPSWTQTELFDIQATIANHEEIRTSDQYGRLLLSLLDQSFGLKYHREPREAPIYWLILDKLNKPGHNLKPTAGAAVNISMNGGNIVDMHASNITLDDFAKAIQKRAGRPTEDHTGLTGRYDLQMKWATEPSPESDDPPLSAALKEQLGLKLQPQRGRYLRSSHRSP